MNLYIRLLIMLLTTRFKESMSIFDDFVTSHYVFPNDLDPYGHMNNGRYFAVADLARIQKLLRAGIWQAMRIRKVYAVAAGETIQFRKPLTLLQKYSISTRMMGWDERFFYVEQAFFRKGQVHALMIVRVRPIMKNDTRVTPREVLGYVYSNELEGTRTNEAINKWNESTKWHWKEAKQ
jgi:acyl-CoA thioesterase FadM